MMMIIMMMMAPHIERDSAATASCVCVHSLCLLHE